MDDDILNYHVRIQCIALIPRHNAPPGVICGLEDGHILFFDNFREGKYQMRRLLKEADLKSIRKMLVYNGGKKVLAGGDGGALIFCNTDKEYSRSFKMHDGPINCLAVTNDRPYAITGSDDGSLRVWDLGDVEDKANWSWCTGKDPPRARILSEFYSDGPINCVKLSSNGHIVAGGRDGAVHILELLGLSKRSR